jgi:hypothetical protein
MYLALTLIQNLALIVFMLIGVQWGISGVAVADVAATYLLIAPTLYLSYKDSPLRIGTFFSTIVRPAIASIVMAIVLAVFRRVVPTLVAPMFLTLGGLVALAVFILAWVLMPGGKAELAGLLSDVRSALQRRLPRLSPLEPVVVADQSQPA